MYFGLHTTKKAERDLLLEQGSYESIEIDPYSIHGIGQNKPIVWDEHSKIFYEHNTEAFYEVLKMIEQGKTNLHDSRYFEMWKHKGDEIITRLRHLPGLFNSIKENGIKEPIAVELTGERLDGSYRTKIAQYLGIRKVKARLYRFRHYQIDEEFIERKLKARWMSSGRDYYEFDYGYKDWKNIRVGGEVFKENALDRWQVIEPLLGSDTSQRITDLGCNEGYMSLMAARKGFRVSGYDTDWTHISDLNKLIFEWIDKKPINCEFYERDITKAMFSGEGIVLALNFIYHIPREAQINLLKNRGGRWIFQCNLRKEAERDKYYGSHPDDLKELLKATGKKVIKEINFRDKPIIIAI